VARGENIAAKGRKRYGLGQEPGRSISGDHDRFGCSRQSGQAAGSARHHRLQASVARPVRRPNPSVTKEEVATEESVRLAVEPLHAATAIQQHRGRTSTIERGQADVSPDIH
jgi:hypothetical protein